MKYYTDKGKQFFDDTVNVNMQMHYDKFLSFLPKQAKIIDAGCGSGRDAKYFLKV